MLLTVDDIPQDIFPSFQKFVYLCAKKWVIVKNSSQKNLSAICQSTVGRLLANCWLFVGRLSVDCQPTVGRLLADRWPTGFGQSTDQQSADSWPTDGQQSVTCR